MNPCSLFRRREYIAISGVSSEIVVFEEGRGGIKIGVYEKNVKECVKRFFWGRKYRVDNDSLM